MSGANTTAVQDGNLSNDTPTSSTATVPTRDPSVINELLAAMKANMENIGMLFQTANEQSTTLSAVGPSMQDSLEEIQALRRQLRAQDKKQDIRVNEIKSMVKNLLKDEVATEMQEHIREQIKEEIARQTRTQMKMQVVQHLPMPLRQQVLEGKSQIVHTRHALMNSEARRTNSVLDADYLDDPIAVIVKPDGTKSDLYPADLRSLFSYDTKMMTALLKDYALPVSESRDTNILRFMRHVGVPLVSPSELEVLQI